MDCSFSVALKMLFASNAVERRAQCGRSPATYTRATLWLRFGDKRLFFCRVHQCFLLNSDRGGETGGGVDGGV